MKALDVIEKFKGILDLFCKANMHDNKYGKIHDNSMGDN
jgi:hypothetical protein